MNPGDDAHTIAAKILMEMCVKNDSTNPFLPGIKLAIAFLENTQCDLEDTLRARAMRDLKSILDDTPVLSSLRDWAKSHFP